MSGAFEVRMLNNRRQLFVAANIVVINPDLADKSDNPATIITTAIDSGEDSFFRTPEPYETVVRRFEIAMANNEVVRIEKEAKP